MKQLSSQTVIGQQGINLVEKIVLGMKYAWRPTSGFDVGIDGEIEICDPVTGSATNSYIKVQVKSTSTSFQAESAESLEFSCAEKDISYWLSGNAPVILIVCRPQTEEAYWVSIKEYFHNPVIQKTKKVIFNKLTHRFDINTAQNLKNLALSPDTGVFFSPQNKNEILLSNLLRVKSFSENIYVAQTEFRKGKDLADELWRLTKNAGHEWILKDKMIISFWPLNEFPFNKVSDPGTCEHFSSDEWAETDDEVRKRDFVSLLNTCLRQKVYLRGLRYHKEHEFYYFPPTDNLQTRKYHYKSMNLHTSREVFKQYLNKKDPSKKTYCRHSAFKGFFQQLGDSWFLEITPTYHFTRDGRSDYPYREELLKGIKRLDRNPAIVGQLLMWQDILSKNTNSLFNNSEYPFLEFSNLETVSIEVGICDDIWFNTEDSVEKLALAELKNQPRFVGI